jgi:hypothetical protein
MLKHDATLFHIDFGYIVRRDLKMRVGDIPLPVWHSLT